MTKKEQIVRMYEEGATPIEISKKLGVYNSNVYKILKDYRLEKELKVLRNK